MNILAIETTGAEASVAVINDEGEVFMETSDKKMSHLQNLMPMMDILLKNRGLTIGDINCIAVSEGPGSFTGIRIGVSSARALAQALGIMTVGVPTLKSFLYHVPDYRGIVCPILDARRNQVYGGAYRWTAAGGTKRSSVERPGSLTSCWSGWRRRRAEDLFRRKSHFSATASYLIKSRFLNGKEHRQIAIYEYYLQKTAKGFKKRPLSLSWRWNYTVQEK